MKILHVIQSIDPANGGPPVVATRLAAAQANLGHEVHLVAYQDVGSEKAIEKFLEGLPGKEGIQYHILDPISGFELVTGANAKRTLNEIIPEMDFVHGHSVWSTIVRVASTVCRSHHVPYTVCIHGMLDPWCMAQKKLKKQIAMKIAYFKMLNGCTFIHCLNKDEMGFVQSFGFKASLETIPNGVFIEEFEPPPERGVFRKQHPEIGDRPYVFFLSRLHYKKGLDYLADSFAAVASKFPDAMLVVAGPDGGAQADFEQRVERANLQDRVLITGPIYGPAKLEALIDSTCFCLPSRQEGFSIAITEALAIGVPAVVTDACHYPEVAQGEAGVVTELSVESIAEGLSQILGATPAQQATFGENGKKLVRENFTWPIVAQRSIQMYEKYT